MRPVIVGAALGFGAAIGVISLLAVQRRLSRVTVFQFAVMATGVALIATAAVARAPGAIDAVCLMYTNSKMMKESMLPHTGSLALMLPPMAR